MNFHDDDMATPAKNCRINKDYEISSSDDEQEAIKSEADVDDRTTSIQSSTRSDRPIKYRSDGKKYVNKNSLSEEELVKEKQEAFKKDKSNMTEEERREAQRVANSLSTFQSRQRRKEKIERLENRVEELTEESSSLREELQALQEENKKLKSKEESRIEASLHVPVVQNQRIGQKLPPSQTRNQQLYFGKHHNLPSSSAFVAGTSRNPSRPFQETLMLEHEAAELGLRNSQRTGITGIPVQQRPIQNYLDVDLALNDGRQRTYSNFLNQQQTAGLTEQAGFFTNGNHRTNDEIPITRTFDIPVEEIRLMISRLISEINNFDSTTMEVNDKQQELLSGLTAHGHYSQHIAEQQRLHRQKQALQEQEERILLLREFQRQLGKREKYG